MKKSIKVTVPKPCEKQEWSSEFISNREQLCLLCSEKVFDATNLSDNELYNLVNQKERPKCMKFKQSQLNRPLLVATTNHFNYKQISNAFYGLLVAGLVVSCSVQKPTQKSIAEYEQLFQTDPFFSDTLQYVIRGIVVDKTSMKPVKNYSVSLIFDGGYGVLSDGEGRFKLNIPKYSIKDTITISIIGRDYETDYYEEITVLKSQLPFNQLIFVQQTEQVIIGSYITY
ncbi:carboxypeptidase-like regulatory domain-containing protein [Flavobacterium sp. CBA20B-1]|uniref:carboxypeptidase-like regulatory domain-containing protein n=1 Tax=unclassified Flavobacterium TaxID=196869 RepID=UPI00222476CE|nr:MULTISPECIES: carboxypeptidase-like regulatory domain-containing protein [unclassified Flavobacterium]WCM41377.1 carboxypeptidase-like regulatory domain-containing protein [Flavobacterium sp. CBA20B-1]